MYQYILSINKTNMIFFNLVGTIINEKGLINNIIINNLNKKMILNDIYKYDKNKYSNIILNINNKLLYNNSIEVFPGTYHILDTIKSKNIKIGITSNFNSHITNNLIHRFNLNNYIDDYISCENSNFMINDLMSKNNINNFNNIINISDSISDLKYSKSKQSLKTFAVLSGEINKKQSNDLKIDYTFNNIFELNKIL